MQRTATSNLTSIRVDQGWAMMKTLDFLKNMIWGPSKITWRTQCFTIKDLHVNNKTVEIQNIFHRSGLVIFRFRVFACFAIFHQRSMCTTLANPHDQTCLEMINPHATYIWKHNFNLTLLIIISQCQIPNNSFFMLLPALNHLFLESIQAGQ